MHDIAIENHIFLAFQAEFAGFLGAGFAVVFHIVGIADGFGTDEALFKIRVDNSRCGRALLCPW